jgi:hypothetical protein
MARNPTTPRLPDPAASGAAPATTGTPTEAPTGAPGGAPSGVGAGAESSSPAQTNEPPAGNAGAEQLEADKVAAEKAAADKAAAEKAAAEKAAADKAAAEKAAAEKAAAENAAAEKPDPASIAIDQMTDAQCDAALAALEGTDEAVAAQNQVCREIRETINRQTEELKARLGAELRKLNQLIDVNLHAAERRRAIQGRKEQLAQQLEQARLALELADKAKAEAAEAKKNK